MKRKTQEDVARGWEISALDGQVNFPLWSMPCTLTSGSGEQAPPSSAAQPPDPRKLMYEVQFQPLRTSDLCVRKGHVDNTGLKKKVPESRDGQGIKTSKRAACSFVSDLLFTAVWCRVLWSLPRTRVRICSLWGRTAAATCGLRLLTNEHT